MFTRMLTIVRASLRALPLAMVLAAGASAYLALRINISVSDDPPCISRAAARRKRRNFSPT